MMGSRCSWAVAMFGSVVMLCVMLLPAPAAFAEGSATAEVSAPQGVVPDQVAEAPAKGVEETVSKDAGADQRIAVRDPVTGEVIDVEKVDPKMTAKLPPGDIEGSVMEPDGITAHSNVTLALVDARTGKTLTTTTTDKNGRFLLKDVPEGLYLMFLGNPGLAAVLTVTKEAELGFLNIVLAEPASSPFPEWAPEWMHEHPVRATVLGGALIVGPLALFAGGGGGGGGYITPITP